MYGSSVHLLVDADRPSLQLAHELVGPLGETVDDVGSVMRRGALGSGAAREAIVNSMLEG